MLEVVNHSLKVLLDSSCLVVPEISIIILALDILLFFGVEERFMLESGLFGSLRSNFEVTSQSENFVVEFVNFSFEVRNLEVPFLDFLLQFVVKCVRGIDLSFVLQLALMGFLLELSPLPVPLLGLRGLSIKPVLVGLLQLFDFGLQFADFSLVEPFHFLHFQIQCFDFLVLVLDLLF